MQMLSNNIVRASLTAKVKTVLISIAIFLYDTVAVGVQCLFCKEYVKCYKMFLCSNNVCHDMGRVASTRW